MKLVTGILLIHILLVFGDQSTEIPSDYTTKSVTDIPDPTSPITSTTSTSTQGNSDPINRDFNAWWAPTYKSWRTTPAPVPIPISTQAPVYMQSSKWHNYQCGQIGVFQRYQVSDHDSRGKCKNCDEIGRKRAQIRRVDPHISRVIHGRNALQGEVPWNIEIYHHNNVFKTCGATLISPNKVLSAAHCFHKELREFPHRRTNYVKAATWYNYQRSYFNYKAVAGLKYPELRRNSRAMQTRDIAKIAIPRKYKGHTNRMNKKFDIAVLILQTPFSINEYVIPACLPTPSLQLQYGLGVISGLGITENKTLSDSLKRAEMEIMPGSKCKKELRKISREVQNNNPEYEKIFNGAHMLCGFGKRRKGQRIDSCQGDSGGPLVVKINNAYTVVGVISWGVGPGGKSCGGPGAYSKVSKYLNFINLIN